MHDAKKTKKKRITGASEPRQRNGMLASLTRILKTSHTALRQQPLTLSSLRSQGRQLNTGNTLENGRIMSTAALDTIADSVSIQDTNFRIVYQNLTAKKIFGDCIGEYCYRAYRKNKSICEQCALAEAFKDGKNHTREQTIANKSGDVCLEVTATPVKDAAGAIVAGIEIGRDITGRKQAEEKIKHLASFPQLNPNPIIEIDSHGTVTYYNTAAGEILKRLGEEHTVSLLFPADFKEILNVLREREESPALSREVKVADRTFAETVHLVKELGAVRIYAYDITERKQAEHERTRLLNVLERSLNEVYMFEADTLRFRYVNTGALRNLGYSRAEIESMTPLDLKPEFTAASFREIIGPLLNRRKDKQIFYTQHRRADGSLYPVEVHLQLVEHEQDRMFLAVIIDITERKRSEEKIVHLNRVYALLSNVNQAIVRTRDKQELYESICRIAVEDGKFRMSWIGLVDEESKKVNMVSSHGFIGDYLDHLNISLTDTPEGYGPTGTAIRQNKYNICNNIEQDERMKPWKERALKNEYGSSACFPLRVFDRTIGALNLYSSEVGIFKEEEIKLLEELAADISYAIEFLESEEQRKRAEEERLKLQMQLLQAQKMEAVGQLAGGIAHDFNNILTAIIGYGNLICMKTLTDDPHRPYIDQILSAADRAAGLTQGLLAFSRKQIINPRPVTVNAVIEQVQKLLHRIIGEDIELKTVLTGENTTVLADAGQLEQILINLCTNARDAMPEGGHLTIETRPGEIDSEYIRMHGYGTRGEYVLISVTDSGEGMDKRTQERIFEPFFTTKELGKGTGLGLSIVYGSVKQHNGFVNVYSEAGRGTTFTIYLPLLRAEAQPARPVEPARPPKGGTETILLAEDDAVLRRLAKGVLEEFGYTVIEAVDGGDAVEKFGMFKDRIQLLVLDVIMPNKNGRETFEEAKKIKPGIKALFTSGYPADIIQKKGILSPGINFIVKPHPPQELLKKVREVLDG